MWPFICLFFSGYILVGIALVFWGKGNQYYYYSLDKWNSGKYYCKIFPIRDHNSFYLRNCRPVLERYISKYVYFVDQLIIKGKLGLQSKKNRWQFNWTIIIIGLHDKPSLETLTDIIFRQLSRKMRGWLHEICHKHLLRNIADWSFLWAYFQGDYNAITSSVYLYCCVKGKYLYYCND